MNLSDAERKKRVAKAAKALAEKRKKEASEPDVILGAPGTLDKRVRALSGLKELYDTEASYLEQLERFKLILNNSTCTKKLNAILKAGKLQEYINSINDAIACSKNIKSAYERIFTGDMSDDAVLQGKLNEFSDIYARNCEGMTRSIELFAETSKNSDVMEKLEKVMTSLPEEQTKKLNFSAYSALTMQRATRYPMLLSNLHAYIETSALSENSKQVAAWYERFTKYGDSVNSKIKAAEISRGLDIYLDSKPGIKISNISGKFNHSHFFDGLVDDGELGNGFSFERDKKNKNKLIVKLNRMPVMRVSIGSGGTLSITFNVSDKYKSKEKLHQNMSDLIEHFKGKIPAEKGKELEYRVISKELESKLGKKEKAIFTDEELALIKLQQSVSGKPNSKPEQKAVPPMAVPPAPAVQSSSPKSEPRSSSLYKDLTQAIARREERKAKRVVQEGWQELAKKQQESTVKKTEPVDPIIATTTSSPGKTQLPEGLADALAKHRKQVQALGTEETPPPILGPKPPRALPSQPGALPSQPVEKSAATTGAVAEWRKNIASRQENASGSPWPKNAKPLLDVPTGGSSVSALRKRFENPDAVPPRSNPHRP